MIVNRYNWEDGAIDWEFLNLNWEDVYFKFVTNTITVTVSGIDTTVTISKEVLDNINVEATNIKYDKGINISVQDINIAPKGVSVSDITFTDT